MNITEIKPIKQHLYRIMLSSGEEILLDKTYAEEKCLKIGDEILSSDIKKMKEESDYRRAISRCMWYLERGDISEKKLMQKLKTAGFNKETCCKAVLRMTELGLINDFDYAYRLTENYLKSGVSQRETLSKLINKGVSLDVAKEVLDCFECDPQEQIKAVIKKKYAAKLQNEEDIPKVFAALQRKGFCYSDIKAVLKIYSEELKYSED